MPIVFERRPPLQDKSISESQECIQFKNLLYRYYANYSDAVLHFAGERKCSLQTGALLKRMGVLKGVSDYFIAVPIHGYGGMWLEVKSKSKTARLSKEQVEFQREMLERGYACAVAYGHEQCFESFQDYLKGEMYYGRPKSSFIRNHHTWLLEASE